MAVLFVACAYKNEGLFSGKGDSVPENQVASSFEKEKKSKKRYASCQQDVEMGKGREEDEVEREERRSEEGEEGKEKTGRPVKGSLAALPERSAALAGLFGAAGKKLSTEALPAGGCSRPCGRCECAVSVKNTGRWRGCQCMEGRWRGGGGRRRGIGWRRGDLRPEALKYRH